MNLVVLGAPGVGKGTYTKLLCKRVELPHISTGDMFRKNIKENTELGQAAKMYMEQGQLVPDELTIKMLKNRLEKPDCSKGFVLDGFPRTINQAEALEQIADIDNVLNFVARKDIIIDRLSGRRVCKDCGATYHVRNVPPEEPGVCDKCGGNLYQREDDKPEAIAKRLEVYQKKTAPLIDYYEDKLIEVDVNSPYSERFEVLDKIQKVI